MSQQTQSHQLQQSVLQDTGSVTPFAAISEPGAYVANWCGHLIRIPEDGLARGRSPVINMVGVNPLTVTKIADNPFVTLTKARLLAANLDVEVSF